MNTPNMSSTSSSMAPTLSLSSQAITSTFYITLFTLGSVFLILLIIIGCYSIFLTHRPPHRRARLFSDPPSAKRGLDGDSVGRYPTAMFSQVKIQHGSSSTGDSLGCSICLAEYKEVDVVLLLPNCGHFFHVTCVDQWLRLRPTCPLCRDLPLPASIRSNSGGLEGQELGVSDRVV